MRRYIDADKLTEAFVKAAKQVGNIGDQIAFRMMINEIPTADVRENVRGEWVTPTEKVYSIDGEDITSAYKECNRCHKVYVRTNDNFCPNCGADMRGDKT